jgi:PKHD-type hydroxylase
MIYPIEPRNPAGKDASAYWDNFLTDDEINQILARPEWLNSQKGEIGGQTGSGGEVDAGKRTTDISWLTCTPETVQLWHKISNVVAEVNRSFFHFDLTGCYEPMQLGIYKEDDGGHYDWHTDSSMTDSKVPRKLSMTLLLSDPSEFEGGNLEIKPHSDEPIKLEMVKGRAWFFPSYVLHRVTPVTKGIRRSLVLWVGGPAFK